MPNYQAMAERANFRLNRSNIGAIDAALVAPGTDIAEAARQLEIATTDAEVAYLRALPPTFKEMLRSVIHTAVTHEGFPLPVQLTWAPGYDFEMSVWESAGTGTSIGGVTVHLRTRYPADQIPGVQVR